MSKTKVNLDETLLESPPPLDQTVVVPGAVKIPPLLPSANALIRQRTIHTFENGHGQIRFTLESVDDPYSFSA